MRDVPPRSAEHNCDASADHATDVTAEKSDEGASSAVFDLGSFSWSGCALHLARASTKGSAGGLGVRLSLLGVEAGAAFFPPPPHHDVRFGGGGGADASSSESEASPGSSSGSENATRQPRPSTSPPRGSRTSPRTPPRAKSPRPSSLRASVSRRTRPRRERTTSTVVPPPTPRDALATARGSSIIPKFATPDLGGGCALAFASARANASWRLSSSVTRRFSSLASSSDPSVSDSVSDESVSDESELPSPPPAAAAAGAPWPTPGGGDASRRGCV